MNGEILEIASPADAPSVFVEPEGERWTVSAEEGHGHFSTVAEALDAASGILKGSSRFVTEYRGETLSATWIEEWDGSGYAMTNIAFFLCPFDSDEWSLRSGETWRTVRTSRTYQPEARTIAVSAFERIDEKSQAYDGKLSHALDEGLGRPEPEMRWTLGEDQRFVFQAPIGWRRNLRRDETTVIDFIPEEDGLVFRAYNFYRDATKTRPERLGKAVSPDSIQFERATGKAPWHSHKWTLMFMEGEYHIMGVFELFYQTDTELQADALIDPIAQVAAQSLFVPLNWNMSRS